jgi:hypothetical protein
LNSAREAFQDAIKIFSTQLTNDERKRDAVQIFNTLEDVQKCVSDAKAIYDDKHKRTKVRDQLVKFSARVKHYGNVMDVLVSHHPEYVALAWGAMKFCFTVSIGFL